MNITNDPFWQDNKNLFDNFDEVYLFGSALEKNQPRDIDLVVVYGDSFTAELRQDTNVIQSTVLSYFGCEAHLTILSSSEKREAQMLKNLKTIKIK